MKKSLLSLALAATLIFSGTLAAIPQTADAASSNKALRQKVSIPKTNGIKDIDKVMPKVRTEVSIASNNRMKYSKSATAGYTIYVPQDMLAKNGAGIVLNCWVDYDSGYLEDGYIGSVSERYDIGIENVKGKVKVIGAYDSMKDKYVSAKTAKKYVSSIKKVEKYYKITVKGMTFNTKTIYYNDKEMKIKDVLSTSEEYYMVTIVRCYPATKKKISGQYMWFDDITLKQGSTVKYDFSSKNYHALNGCSGGKDNVVPKVFVLNTSKVK